MDDPTEPTERVCTACLLCLRQDHGYSNYTVEGTNLHCLAGANPALDGQEEPYRDMTPELAAAVDVAKVCPLFRAGVPVWMDVDTEGIPYPEPATVEVVKTAGYTDDDAAAELLVKWLSSPPGAPPE